MKAVTFKDRVKLHVAAGNGGDGCASFRREKYVPRGGPDGGDGGKGGHVYLQADKNVDSLLPLYYQPHQRAGHGQPGRGQRKHGKNGADLHVKVPPGTEARLAETDEELGEVLHDGEALLVARGGKGGLGNVHFTTSSHQAPREFTEGTPGEVKSLSLELKLVADIGLVGYPNAGKSSLLCAISSAHPKTAPYPFTTLNPIIGTVQYEDYHNLRVADIPGLIDGAHEGVGLGHDFLRHIERTRFLLFVVDVAGVDGRNPVEDYANLRKELRLYRDELDRRPHLIVANKIDMDEGRANLPDFVKHTGEQPLEVSATVGTRIDALKASLHERFFGPGGLSENPAP